MSAPFRIKKPSGVQRVSAATPGAQREEQFKLYLDRLLKLIPAEVVSLYLVGNGFIPEDNKGVLVIWALVGLIATIVARAYATMDPEANLPPQWPAVLISAISFVIWVYTLGGPFEAFDIHTPYLGSLLVLAWTFFVPYFYKGD